MPGLVSEPAPRTGDVGLTISIVSAHQQAWEKAGVLHRDISGANILITGSGAQCRGILIDWDMCKYKDTEGALSGPAFRSVGYFEQLVSYLWKLIGIPGDLVLYVGAASQKSGKASPCFR